MIDIEPQIFAQLSKRIRDSHPGTSVSGESTNSPAAFPYVSILENDNYIPTRLQDSSNKEKHAEVMYEIAVYSNLVEGKKRQCREILNTIDEWMVSRNFTRYSMSPVPNMNNSTIARYVARYRAVTDGKKIYRR